MKCRCARRAPFGTISTVGHDGELLIRILGIRIGDQLIVIVPGVLLQFVENRSIPLGESDQRLRERVFIRESVLANGVNNLLHFATRLCALIQFVVGERSPFGTLEDVFDKLGSDHEVSMGSALVAFSFLALRGLIRVFDRLVLLVGEAPAVISSPIP